MDLDLDEDFHKYITALWFWSMNLTSKVFIIWNSYTKHQKQKRLKEALNKSQNSLNRVDDLKSFQHNFKDNDFFQADLLLLAGSFTESSHFDLFQPLAESNSDSDKEKSDDEDNTGRHLSNEKHESPVTTCMSENLETSLNRLCLKDAEAKVFLTGRENEMASDKEVGHEDETCEDSGRTDGSEEILNLIVDVVGNKREDDFFRLQQEANDTAAAADDDNYDNEVIENCYNHQDDSNFGDDIDLEQEVDDEEDCDIDDNSKPNITDFVNNHDEDDSKHNGDNVDNDYCNTDDDDNDDDDKDDDNDCDDDDNNKSGAGESNEIDINSRNNIKILSEENVKEIAPVNGEFKGATSFKKNQQWFNNNHLSLLIELNCPWRQVRAKSNFDSNAFVEDDVLYVQDISTQTETVAEEILQTCLLPPERSTTKFNTFSHPFATKTIHRSGNDSQQLVPPDAFHVTEKDMHPFDADSNYETSCNIKTFDKKFNFPPVAERLERVTGDVHKTMCRADPNSSQFASELPPLDERSASGRKADVLRCSSKHFWETCRGKTVKWIDEIGCKNNGKIPVLESREVPGIPLYTLAAQFQLKNNSEDISSQIFNEKASSDENIYPPSDIVSKLCSIFNKTRITRSDQSFAEILSQNNIVESVEKSLLQRGTLERNTSSKDFEIKKDAKLDLDHVNEDCLEELERIRKRLKDFQELKSRLEHALDTQEQLVEIMNDKTLSGNDVHNSLNVRSLSENLKKEIATLTSRYCSEESRCLLIAKRAKHLLNEMYI